MSVAQAQKKAAMPFVCITDSSFTASLPLAADRKGGWNVGLYMLTSLSVTSLLTMA